MNKHNKIYADFGAVLNQLGSVLGGTGAGLPITGALGLVSAITSQFQKQKVEQQQQQMTNYGNLQRDMAQSRAYSETFSPVGDNQFNFDSAAYGKMIPKKKMKNGGAIKKKNIEGPSHEQGGTDIQVNNQQVEAEGGEVRVDLPDGTAVILSDRIGPDEVTTYAQLGKAAQSDEELYSIAQAQVADPRMGSGEVAQTGGLYDNPILKKILAPQAQSLAPNNINAPKNVPLFDEAQYGMRLRTSNNNLYNTGTINPINTNRDLVNLTNPQPKFVAPTVPTSALSEITTKQPFDFNNIVPFIDNISNFFLTKGTPNIVKPVLDRQPVLRDNIDTGDQLNQIDQSVGSAFQQAKGLRGGSGDALRQAAVASGISGKNQVLSDTANKEVALQNQNALIRQQVASGNAQKIGDYNTTVFNRDQAIRQQLSANLANANQDILGMNRDKRLFELEAEKYRIVSAGFDRGVIDRNLPIAEIAKRLGLPLDDPATTSVIEAVLRQQNK